MGGGAARRLDDLAVAGLAAEVRGRVVTPVDPDYDTARAVWNGSIDRYPALVVRCTGPDDVAAALRFGVRHELPVAVRGGGHNVAGFGSVDDGIVIDTGPMKDITVDADGHTVVAGAGVTGGELDRATQAHGLATTLGVMSTTGIVGLTLGGGIGWLQRRYGLACDNLIAADLVTVDGTPVRASESSHRELFWGLRGGGGNFGVVTSLTYRLHPVGPEVLCGLAVWRAEEAPEVLRFLRGFAGDAPDELTLAAVHRTAPSAPWLDPRMHGQPIVAVAACYAGAVEDGEAVLAPLRSFGPPVADVYAPRPYADFQSMFDAAWDPGFRNYWKAEYLAALDDGVIDALGKYAISHTSPLSDFKVVLMGGAVARVPEGATACGGRDAPWVLNINTRWTDPAEDDRHIAHTRSLFEAVQPASAGRTFVNFLGDEGDDRVRHAYGSTTYERLRALKRIYDPHNVLRVNQNIPPAD